MASKTDSLKTFIAQNNNPAQKLYAIISLAETIIKEDFAETIKYSNEGLNIAASLKDSFAIGKLERIKGEAYYFKGSYDNAAKSFYNSIQIFERTHNDKELAYSLNHIAKLYRKTRELDKAAQYYNMALSIFENINDSSGIQMIWNESGVVYEYKEDYTEAATRYQKALDIAILRKDSLSIGYSYNFLGGLYTLQKKFSEAEKYMGACLKIREQMQDSFALALTHADFGAMYLAKADHKNAIKSFLQSNVIATKMKFAELLSSNYKQMAITAKQTGDYKQAFEYYETANNIKDSIFTIEKTKQIEELNTKYQTEKKEQQLAIQNLALTKKNYLIGGIIVFIMLASLLGYSQYHRYKLKQETRLQEVIITQQDQATKAVIEAEEKERYRIAQDLHDGVGQMMSAVKLNLSSFETELGITDENLKKKFENIFTLVDDSCKEVRSVSHDMMPNALLRSGLASAVKEFLNKIDTREIKINLYAEGLEEHTERDTEIMLYRVIQECVNNVVKHAKASRLDISIIKEEKNLSVTIEDNGVGFDSRKLKTFEGIGLKNITSRVNYLKGSVEFDSKPSKGTVVIINIPLA